MWSKEVKMEYVTIFAVFFSLSLVTRFVFSYDPRVGGVDLVPADEQDGRCVFTDSSRHDVGIPWFYPGDCRKFVCVKKGDEFFVEISLCKDVSNHPDKQRDNCHYEERGGVFPRCCPSYICKPPPTTTAAPDETEELEE